MNKTRTIMAAITASLLMGSPISNSTATAIPQQGEKPLEDKCKRACPKIDEQSAKKILDWLNAHPSSSDEHGKTVAEIVAQIPQLSVEQANKILECLRLTSCVGRSGYGTKEAPYKFYALSGKE
jgi:hypothetical protein